MQNIEVVKREEVDYKIEIDRIMNSFENSIPKEIKKQLGQFYTPMEIVDYIVRYLYINKDSKVLDPSCGCGIFLLRTYEQLKTKYGDKSLLKNLYGVDINDKAIEITKKALFNLSHNTKDFIAIIDSNIKTGNSIVSNKNIDNNAFDWNNFLDKTGGFDFVVGNPPYITLNKQKDFDSKESFYSEIINGQVNAANLMICRSLEVLKEGGILAYVLPKSLLRVHSYSKLRNYLLHNTRIIHLFELKDMFKDVRGEQIILMLMKTSDKQKIKDNLIKISFLKDKSKSLDEQPSFFIKQNLFHYFDNFVLLPSKKHYRIALKLKRKYKPLSDFNIDIFRGLTISSKNRSTKMDSQKHEEIIKGDGIDKYGIKYKLFFDTSKLNKDLLLKKQILKNKKIVLQNIFSSESGIKATLDTKGIATLDTVTNIITNNSLDEYYLLALLNSKLINFFLISVVYNNSSLTMHTDGMYLKQLPIVIPEDTNLGSIKKIIKSILQTKKTDENIDSIKKSYRELDKIIYKTYNINNEEIEIIENFLKGRMSKKTFW